MSHSLTGTGAVAGRAKGPAFVVEAESGAIDVGAGAVMVVRVFHPYFAPVLGRIVGLVVEEGGLLQHAVILAREFDIPTVVGVGGATQQIATGVHLMLDGTTGTVTMEAADGPTRGHVQ